MPIADRVPMVIMGATGPVDAAKRRPWIDWIHTAADQAAMVRDYLKWDDQPASAEAIAESVLRAHVMASTAPMGPTYVCLDTALQETPLDGPIDLSDPARYPVGAPPGPDTDGLARAAEALKTASKVVILAGHVSRREADWNRRIALAEALNAKVYTALKLAASFPVSHLLCEGMLPLFQSKDQLQALAEADVVLSLDWLDLKTILAAAGRADDDSLTVIHSSLERYAHSGAVMDYLGLPHTDVMLLADPDTTTRALVDALGIGEAPEAFETKPGTHTLPDSKTISMAHLAEATTKALSGRKTTYACLPFDWPAAAAPFDHPLDYLGADAGGVIGAGPPFAVGAALAMQDIDPDRLVVLATGDGDLLSGMACLWTAGQRKLPMLAIINNNRSFMNDERHQDRVAQMRGRPRENKWVGQRLDDPPPDLCGLAKAQGWATVGPVALPGELPEAFDRASRFHRQRTPDTHRHPGGPGRIKKSQTGRSAELFYGLRISGVRIKGRERRAQGSWARCTHLRSPIRRPSFRQKICRFGLERVQTELFWPSLRVDSPARSTAEIWTKASFEPSEGSMNP